MITIFESSENIGVMEGIFSSLLSSRSLPDTGIRDLIEQAASYAPIERFTLRDEHRRIFAPERFCFRESVDEWISIGAEDSLEVAAGKFIPHLGEESFFELY